MGYTREVPSVGSSVFQECRVEVKGYSGELHLGKGVFLAFTCSEENTVFNSRLLNLIVV